jgi:large subunit ribosomal protein L32
MAVPKKRTSHSKRNMRRSHDALTPRYGIVCPNCGDSVLRHRSCGSCGYYRGKLVGRIKDQAETSTQGDTD